MNTIKLAILILLGSSYSCAQQISLSEDKIISSLYTIEQADTFDFTEIGKAIGESRIVALGESSHGIGEYYKVKAALVEYLYKEKNFEVIAMEGGLGDINIAYANLDTLSAIELRNNSVFANFRTIEVLPMYKLIKETSTSEKPLLYTGYDTQFSSDYFRRFLTLILKPYNHQLSESLGVRYSSYGKMFQAMNSQDSVAYNKHRDIIKNTIDEVSLILINNSEEIKDVNLLTDVQFELILRTLAMSKQSVDLDYVNRWSAIELRDKLMYENLEWIMTEMYPNKKVIIWAHNAHVENSSIKGSQMKWMGHFLKEKYPKNYFSIGFFTFKGQSYQHWTKQNITFENSDSTHIENKLVSNLKPLTFLDLNTLERERNSEWLFNYVNAYEVENGGIISFVPVHRFDGIITIYKSGPPTFEE